MKLFQGLDQKWNFKTMRGSGEEKILRKEKKNLKPVTQVSLGSAPVGHHSLCWLPCTALYCCQLTDSPAIPLSSLPILGLLLGKPTSLRTEIL